jgi:beta-glucosidase
VSADTVEESMTVDDSDFQAHIGAARRTAHELVARLTREEKLQLVHGTGRPSRTHPDGTAGRIAGVPRLGIPDLVMGDGPNGVGNGATGVTAYPCAIAVAASWNLDLMTRVGAAIGAEHLRKGHGVALTPTVNMLRLPHWGRSFETFGEDPYLTSQLGQAQIRGVQASGAIASVKHLAANNQEDNRWDVDAVVSERALREIYLPAFEAAVQAGVLSVMAAYNRVNGTFACENGHLMAEILHGEWGFLGFTVSDWGATHGAASSALAGLDVEMPHGPLPDYPEHFGAELAAAVESGEVPAERLDDMVARVLTAMHASGLTSDNHGHADASATSPEHRALAREAATAGIVLLRNDHNALPLSADVRSVAVIGVAADSEAVITGGGSALVHSDVVVTPLGGIRAHCGQDVDVRFSPGTAGTGMLPAIPAEALRSRGGEHGWDSEYYATPDRIGDPVTAVEPQIDEGLSGGHDLSPGWSARWTTTFTPGTSGQHRFSLDASGHAILLIGDLEELENDGRDRSAVQHTAVDLTAGTPVRLELLYRAELLEKRTPRVGVGMLPPDPDLLAAAVDTARSSDAAIVVVNDLRTEGSDVPSLALPADQDQLIAAVAAANPRTVVVLHIGGPVLMPWLEHVPAALVAWYPGQESGDALSDVLFGTVNPAGRLPATFPAADDQHPAAGGSVRYPGLHGVMRYEEELQIGYRWWQSAGEVPLFPFGHGLSYTRFDYEDLAMEVEADEIVVRWSVRNVGSRQGREVAQLYLGYPDSAGDPPLQLRGFRDFVLDAGQTQRVELRLGTRERSRWDSATHSWTTALGQFRIVIGASSQDHRLTGTITIDGTEPASES